MFEFHKNNLSMFAHNIIRLDCIDSTNRYARETIICENTEEGTTIVANEQYAGKGHEGSCWESEAGKNLTFSILLKPTFIVIEKQFLLNKAISLAIADFTRDNLPDKASVSIKWPNDIYIADKKVAGLLIENFLYGTLFKYAIVGVGININQDVFISDAPNPVSLKNISNKTYNLNICLDQIINFIEKRYHQLKKGFHVELNNDYIASMYRFNEFFTYNIFDKKIEAKIIGVSEIGKLILETKTGKVKECKMKEILF